MTFSLGPRAASAGYRLAAFDQIGSTNAEAMSRARDGDRVPMWFVTSEQTAGRGRRHRPWVAPRGNLASSILEVIDVLSAVAATLGSATLFPYTTLFRSKRRVSARNTATTLSCRSATAL